MHSTDIGFVAASLLGALLVLRWVGRVRAGRAGSPCFVALTGFAIALGGLVAISLVGRLL